MKKLLVGLLAISLSSVSPVKGELSEKEKGPVFITIGLTGLFAAGRAELSRRSALKEAAGINTDELLLNEVTGEFFPHPDNSYRLAEQKSLRRSAKIMRITSLMLVVLGGGFTVVGIVEVMPTHNGVQAVYRF